tara:strand:+ start:1306 stop:2202 length:897 start_codon:yes stop_codon:yes gene_type:complete
MKYIIITILLVSNLNLFSQIKKKKDVETIKSMCGCYEVTFKFAETFNYSKDSTYTPSKNKIAYAVEWIDLTYIDKNNLIIQHILQMGKDSNAYIMKHWRQDWNYQNREFLIYDHNNIWNKLEANYNSTKGQWTQKVFQVDDSPRYEGSASWAYIDDKIFWENNVDAPLPRRERSIRSDYNVLNRGNRIEITNEGWIHKQNNQKILRTDTANDVSIASEYGINSYVKINNERCKYAKIWWNKKSEKWKIVRKEWELVFDQNDTISLKPNHEDKPLWEYLFSDEYSNQNEIKNIINNFVK